MTMLENPGNPGGRPDTVSGMLASVAKWLNLADRCFGMLASIEGETYEPGTTVQADMERLSRYLADHPDVDRELYGAVVAT